MNTRRVPFHFRLGQRKYRALVLRDGRTPIGLSPNGSNGSPLFGGCLLADLFVIDSQHGRRKSNNYSVSLCSRLQHLQTIIIILRLGKFVLRQEINFSIIIN